jgi:hypothetical protein
VLILSLILPLIISDFNDLLVVNWGSRVCALIKQKDFEGSAKMIDALEIELKNNRSTKKKFQKAEIYKAITGLETAIKDADLDCRHQSMVSLQIANSYGIITQVYSTGLGKKKPGRLSFYALKNAHQIDPDFERAWLEYGQVVHNESSKNAIGRAFVESALDISLVQELEEVQRGLQNFSSQCAKDLLKQISKRLSELK